MKVLLVTLQNNTDVIGLKYIHSYLCNHNIDSNILFLPKYNEKDNRVIGEFLKGYNPDLIGVGLMSNEFHLAKNFSSFVKNEFPELAIVWGGIHPSISPSQSLEYADFVFIGESEHAFLEYINAVSMNKPTANILNLAYKSNGKVVINKVRPCIENLDTFFFPEHLPKKSFILHNNQIIRLNHALLRKYARYSGRFYSLLTTRGCPFSCSYCCNSFYSKLYGTAKIRRRSVDNVIEEIKTAVTLYPNIVYINIQDDNFFSYDVQWMRNFVHLYRKEKIGKRFVCRTTPKHVSEEKILMLKEVGLSWIFMGLQTGSERVNREIYKRYVSNETFLHATEIIKRNNIAGSYDVILDNPYETDSDVLETIEVLLKISKPFMLQIFSLCFYHGTEIYDMALRDNIIFEDPRNKTYTKYEQTFFNKIIRLSPLLPKKFIEYLVNNRKKKKTTFLINLVYSPALLVLEPFVWFKLILISLNYNLLLALDMMFSFFVTGFKKIILRKS